MPEKFDEQFIAKLLAELLDANEQAFAVLAGAVADTAGPGFATALQSRLERAQAASSHPIRDRLLATALRAVKAK